MSKRTTLVFLLGFLAIFSGTAWAHDHGGVPAPGLIEVGGGGADHGGEIVGYVSVGYGGYQSGTILDRDATYFAVVVDAMVGPGGDSGMDHSGGHMDGHRGMDHGEDAGSGVMLHHLNIKLIPVSLRDIDVNQDRALTTTIQLAPTEFNRAPDLGLNQFLTISAFGYGINLHSFVSRQVHFVLQAAASAVGMSYLKSDMSAMEGNRFYYGGAQGDAGVAIHFSRESELLVMGGAGVKAYDGLTLAEYSASLQWVLHQSSRITFMAGFQELFEGDSGMHHKMGMIRIGFSQTFDLNLGKNGE